MPLWHGQLLPAADFKAVNEIGLSGADLPGGRAGGYSERGHQFLERTAAVFGEFLGSIAMAGYTAANNIFGFLFVSINSITQACMSFTSQNYGAWKKKRMDLVLVDCMILSVIVAVTLGGGANLFGPQLLHIYTTDADVIACGTEILLYTTLTYFLCGIMDLIPGALRGMGHSAVPMIVHYRNGRNENLLDLRKYSHMHRSLMVLFLSYPASWIVTILLQAVCFYFVRKKYTVPCRRKKHKYIYRRLQSCRKERTGMTSKAQISERIEGNYVSKI